MATMATLGVYLEIGTAGLCLAHVPELPGCAVRAGSRTTALERLPGAIRDYFAWLSRHGEDALPEEGPADLEIIEESIGFGPFDPGDAAALFTPDLAPVTAADLERYLHLMTYTRADLLSLFGRSAPAAPRSLPEGLLDWQVEPGAFTLRRLLRHIGNAEEWYVSRLVPPDTLPREWLNDESLPLFDFLDMERRTAVERLRQLTDQERSAVVRCVHWTDHPGEHWTARKVLRRFLEHEREHTAQAGEILAAFRSREQP